MKRYSDFLLESDMVILFLILYMISRYRVANSTIGELVSPFPNFLKQINKFVSNFEID